MQLIIDLIGFSFLWDVKKLNKNDKTLLHSEYNFHLHIYVLNYVYYK